MLAELRDVVFGYESRPVVHVDHLSLHAGSCLGIFGPNGSGKTTLVRGLVGLLEPLSGWARHADNLTVGHVPQRRSILAHWPMNGLDAAALALSARQRLGWTRRVQSRLRDSLRALEVESLAHRPYAQLSGGQQQRLLLAGALADQPQLLVLDEPTDGLDVHARQLFLQYLKTAASNGMCIVLISHEVQDLLELAQRIVLLRPSDHPNQASDAALLSPEQLIQHISTRLPLSSGNRAL